MTITDYIKHIEEERERAYKQVRQSKAQEDVDSALIYAGAAIGLSSALLKAREVERYYSQLNDKKPTT